MRHLLCLAFAGTLFGLALPASAANYALDTSHSSATFAVRHLIISTVHGTIPIKSGIVTARAGAIPTAVSAILDVSAINTQDAERDKDLRTADWFDTAKYSKMTFTSRWVVGTDPRHFEVHGDLAFHGATKLVSLESRVERSITDSRGKQYVGYSATTTLDRRAWGLTGGGPAVANDITITLDIYAVAK